MPNVACGEEARHARLEGYGVAIEWPALGAMTAIQ